MSLDFARIEDKEDVLSRLIDGHRAGPDVAKSAPASDGVAWRVDETQPAADQGDGRPPEKSRDGFRFHDVSLRAPRRPSCIFRAHSSPRIRSRRALPLGGSIVGTRAPGEAAPCPFEAAR